jgi:hypothetical protein
LRCKVHVCFPHPIQLRLSTTESCVHEAKAILCRSAETSVCVKA